MLHSVAFQGDASRQVRRGKTLWQDGTEPGKPFLADGRLGTMILCGSSRNRSTTSGPR
jgi:hypothetical protein